MCAAKFPQEQLPLEQQTPIGSIPPTYKVGYAPPKICQSGPPKLLALNDNWRLTNKIIASHTPLCQSLTCPDRTSDNFTRSVTLDQKRIIIERVVQTIAMRVQIPTKSYHGVSLRLQETALHGWHYTLTLEHSDKDLCLVLYSADHDQDVIALWRNYAKFLQLPRLIENGDGDEAGNLTPVEPVTNTINPTQRLRRKVFALTKQRPRFLCRRRCGKLSDTPTLIKNETEILARR